jgi:hypothetical protein
MVAASLRESWNYRTHFLDREQESGLEPFPSLEIALYLSRIDLMYRGTLNRFAMSTVGIRDLSRKIEITGLEGVLDIVSAAAWENLHKAALELAKPSGLKQRLTDAFTHYLLDLSPQDLPGESRMDFEALRQSMTRVRPQRGESVVAATVRKMSIGEADACAARIVSLLDSLHRASLGAPARGNGQAQLRPKAAGDTGSSRIPTLISVNRA